MTKRRTSATKTGNRGVLAIEQYCADENLIFQGEPREDFGVDCYVEVEIDSGPTNFLIAVQCKAGPSYRRNRSDGSFVVSVSFDDLAYWAAANVPVLFIYYDLAEQTFYWKHVQKMVSGISSLSEVKHVEFTSADDVRVNSLAEYARRLVQATPTMCDRLHVFASTMTCAADGRSMIVGPRESFDEADFFGSDLPFYTCVIGYSADDRWVLIREIVPLGGLPSEIYAVFLDTENWASLRLPIAVHPEGAPEPDDLPPDLRLIQTTNDVIAKIGFFRPQTVLRRYDFIEGADGAPEPEVALIFGPERFDVSVVGEYQLRALVLENRRFSPPRRATLLSTATVPMKYIDTNFSAIGEAQHLRGICELVVSPSGRTVSIAAISNYDHPCWGAPAISHVHLRTPDLRRACGEALLV